ncbi:MAG: phage holin family protein [Acidimicrobiia bacterium]|nr:phage holin family protein [Acidimicrobiia bacterium]
MANTDPQPLANRETGLVAAFQSVTDGVADLAKHHIDLAKAEARRDVKLFGREAFRVAIGAGLALLGWTFFLVALIALAGYLGGLGAMAATAGVISVVHVWAGAGISRAAMKRMKEREGALTTTKDEIKRSSEWAKQIKPG